MANSTAPKETKPGIYTTEFWLTTGLSALTWIGHAAQSGQLPLKWVAVIQSVLGLAYTVSRGIAKAGQAYYGNGSPK